MNTAPGPASRPGARAEAVARGLAGIRRFAMLPDVTLRIVEVVGSDSGDAGDLRRAVSTDPVLCLRIIKVVNSAFYAFPQPVTTIDRAIVLLGGEAIRNIALAASLGRLAATADSDGTACARDLWLHSLAVAAGAQRVAETAGVAAHAEAFLAGLLHDIGFLVQLQHDRDRLMQVIARVTGGEHPLTAVEDELFGANHQDFGHGLCAQWQLPQSVSDVLGGHHDPTALSAQTHHIACAVHVADDLAAHCGLGFAGHVAAAGHRAAAAALLGLDDDALEPIAAWMPEATAALQQVLG